jgi:hypothetical protein
VSLSFSRRGRRSSAYGITTADGSHLDDVSRRQKQYAATMLFRVAAILVVVFVPGLSVHGAGDPRDGGHGHPVLRGDPGQRRPAQDADPTNLMIGAPRQPELPTPDRSIYRDASVPRTGSGPGRTRRRR